jgi:hypothetical protein
MCCPALIRLTQQVVALRLLDNRFLRILRRGLLGRFLAGNRHQHFLLPGRRLARLLGWLLRRLCRCRRASSDAPAQRVHQVHVLAAGTRFRGDGFAGALLVDEYVYRFDGAASSDNQFAGTAKAWANTEVSVPARAVAQSRTANPMVLIDEIEKAADRHHNGRLWDALLPFLDPETAGRYRDQSLDSELDLSMVSYVGTANDVLKLPAPLRDRMRVIRVPTPSLVHLPALAASVMRDLAAEDEARAGDEPLAEDELAIIGKAWSRAGFSMRSLQKIVGASLEARDQHAMRH